MPVYFATETSFTPRMGVAARRRIGVQAETQDSACGSKRSAGDQDPADGCKGLPAAPTPGGKTIAAPRGKPALQPMERWVRAGSVLGFGARVAPAAARRRAFTLLELLMVVTIIGFLAALSLPNLVGMQKSHKEAAASRQLLDDLNLARVYALANRTTVYVAFLPMDFTNNPKANNTATMNLLGVDQARVNDLMLGQLTSYALIALRTVGDQPGHPRAHYLSPWKTLPEGYFVSPDNFAASVPTLNSPPVCSTNSFTYVGVPFPEASSGTAPNFLLPCLAFTGAGQLAPDPDGFNRDKYIGLSRGSIIFGKNPDGSLVNPVPDVLEIPPGNGTNVIIHVTWLTARSKIEQPQLP